MGSALCTSDQDHDAKMAIENPPSKPNSTDSDKQLQQFIERTGGTSKDAQQFLQKSNHNVDDAVKQYELVKSGVDTSSSAANNTVLDATDVDVDVQSKAVDPVKSLANGHIKTDAVNNSTTPASQSAVTVPEVVPPTAASGDAKTSPQPQVVIRGKLANQRLHRGLSSLADSAGMLDRQRKNILHDLDLGEEVEDSGGGKGSSSSGAGSASLDDGTMENTFVLPDLSSYEAEFRDYIMKTLLEKSTQVCLENTGHLNWWTDLGLPLHLVPMATEGDGNCLLHAASLAMWGFHDRRLTLRTHLNATMTEGRVRDAMYRRWRWQQTQSNMQLGLTLETDQWAAEWSNLLKLSSLTPKRDGCTSPDNAEGKGEGKEETECSKVYESLEEFHVFVLAHVLRRPIVVIADTVLRNVDNEAIAPIPFGGIYLPLERSPAECYNSPLLLAYDAAHFSALVTCAGADKSAEPSTTGSLLPLVDPAFSLLPLHFTVDPGQSFSWDEANEKTMAALEPTLRDRVRLLRQYLDVSAVSASLRNESKGGSVGATIPNGKANHAKSTVASINANQTTKSSSVGKRLLRGVLNRSVSMEESADLKKKEKKHTLSGLRRTFSKRLRLHLRGGKRKVNNSEATDDKKNNSSDIADVPLIDAVADSPEVNQQSEHDEIVDCLTSCRGDRIVCSRIEIKLPDYYDNMVDTFIRTHRQAYEASKGQKATSATGNGSSATNASSTRLSQNINASTSFANGPLAAIAVANDDDDVDAIVPTSCINDNCDGLGIAARCYLCEACYQRQKSEELDATLGRNGKVININNDSAGLSGVDGSQRLSLLSNGSRLSGVGLGSDNSATPAASSCIEALLRKENGLYGSNGTSSLLSNGRLLSNGGLLSPSSQLLQPTICGPSDVEKSLSSLLSSECGSVRLSKSYDTAPSRDLRTLPYGGSSFDNRLASTRRDMQFMTLVSVGRDMCEPPLRAEFERLHLSVSGATSGWDTVAGKSEVTLRNGSALSTYTQQ